MTESSAALLGELLKYPSVTPDESGLMAWIAAKLEAMGFAVHRLTFGPRGGRVKNLYARLGEDAPFLCFAGHTDVVPPGPGWEVEPFSGEISEDALYGRGAVDMKGAIACAISAVQQRLSKGPLQGSIGFLLTGDEEGEARYGTQELVEWLKKRKEIPDFFLLGEPTSQKKIGDVVKNGRRGSLNAEIVVKGQQGHVAYPHLADNPLPRMMALLQSLAAARLDDGTVFFPPSSLQITSLEADSGAENVTPGEARACLNIRFNNLHSGESLIQWLEGEVQAVQGAFCQIRISGEAFQCPDSAGLDRLQEAIFRVTKRNPVLSAAGGTSDARFLVSLAPVAECGLLSETMHRVNERVPLKDLQKLTEIYSTWLTLMAV